MSFFFFLKRPRRYAHSAHQAAVMAAGKAFGLKSLALWCDVGKAGLIEFYKSNGFEHVEVAPNPASTANGRVCIMRATV